MLRRSAISKKKTSDYKENFSEKWKEEKHLVDSCQKANPVWKWMMRGRPPKITRKTSEDFRPSHENIQRFQGWRLSPSFPDDQPKIALLFPAFGEYLSDLSIVNKRFAHNSVKLYLNPEMKRVCGEYEDALRKKVEATYPLAIKESVRPLIYNAKRPPSQNVTKLKDFVRAPEVH